MTVKTRVDNLGKYRKTATEPKERTVTTSVNITKAQKEYLEKNDLNLSRLVRDFLESLIR